MPTAEQILNVARSQLGTRETPVNRTRYGRDYGTDGVAWCQIWAWWVMRQAGASTLVPKSASTIATYDWFKARGRASSTPRPGDLVFFNWRDGSRAWPQPQHVGLVEAVNPNGSLTTLEGNTQSGTTGNQSDGGGVWRRTRAAAPYVVGYGRPAYSSALPFPLPANLPTEEDDLTPEQDAMLRAVYHEATLRLPNRRGPGGSNIKGGGDDTVLGYSANADGFSYRIESLLKQVADRVGTSSSGPAVLTASDRTAIAQEVVELLAVRLAQ